MLRPGGARKTPPAALRSPFTLLEITRMAHFLALSAALAIGWLQKRVLASALRVGIAFFAYCVVNAVASEQGDAVSNVVMNLSKIGWLLCAGMCAYHAYWLEFAAACVFSSLTLSGTFRPWKPTNYLTTIAHTYANVVFSTT